MYSPEQRAAIAITYREQMRERFVNDPLLCDDLMSLYLDNSSTPLSLGKIAQLVCPQDYEIGGSIVQHAVSEVCRTLHTDKILSELKVHPANYPMKPEGRTLEDFAQDLAEDFHEQRTLKVKTTAARERIKNPEFREKTTKRLIESQGMYFWDRNSDTTLFELVQDVANMRAEKETSNSTPNWDLITLKLSKKLGKEFTNPQVKTRYYGILKNMVNYPEFVKRFKQYYVPKVRVSWESIMPIIHFMAQDPNYQYAETKFAVGGRKGDPNWRVILPKIQELGYLEELDLLDPENLRLVAKQISKAYLRHLKQRASLSREEIKELF